MLKQPTDFELFQDHRQLGLTGFNTIIDAADLQDNQSPDIDNMTLDSGILMPRRGTELYAPKPEGETEDALQLMKAADSIGRQYMIAVYGDNFYLVEDNKTILLNNSFFPTEKTLKYGYTSWNEGLGADRLYFCNGVDDFMKWPICRGVLAAPVGASDTTVTLEDAVPFPDDGFVILDDGDNRLVLEYTSKSGNVLNLNGTAGDTMGTGAYAVCAITNDSSMEKGKVVATHDRRLMVANEYQNEVKLAYSATNDPEEFTIGSDPADGGLLIITDGNGEITDLKDFGEYLLVSKKDAQFRFSIDLNQAGDGKLEIFKPLISGDNLGPVSTQASIKVSNDLFYLTARNDLFRLNPTQTGNTSSVKTGVISAIISNYTKGLNFTGSEVAYFEQKIAWLFGYGEVINALLVYDMVREAWLKISGWNAVSIISVNKRFFYLDRITGDIVEGFTGLADIAQDYEAYFYTKRFHHGKPSMPKTADAVYVEGYITPETEFYATVLYNEEGRLTEKTYKIEGAGSYASPVDISALSQSPISVLPLGLAKIQGAGFFRVYLSIPNKLGYYNLQVKFWSNKQGSMWGVSGMAINPSAELIIPPKLRIDPI